jgi:hypothetical protein
VVYGFLDIPLADVLRCVVLVYAEERAIADLLGPIILFAIGAIAVHSLSPTSSKRPFGRGLT